MKVSVLGCGTIGRGIYGMLQKAQGFEAGPVLERKGFALEDFMVDDIDLIVSDPTIDAVVEAIGGIEPSYTYAVKAITAGKHFVSTNKALVAEKGIELSKLAGEHGVGFVFSGACGGGMPILHNISLAVQTDELLSLEGILNGTTNYILDSIQTDGISFEDALASAQQLGYAERDPSADLSGLDTQRKIVLACSVAFGMLPTDGICREGIENFTLEDADYLKSKGLVCRLLAKAGKNEDKLYAYVEPVVVSSSSTIASIHKNFNLAGYVGECSGLMQYIGQGAGRWPTATAALRDLTGIKGGVLEMMKAGTVAVTAENDIIHPYYVRLPKEYANTFEGGKTEISGETAYVFTEAIAVNKMHETVKVLRDQGAKVFFASME